jgi:hypothetical protein
MIMYGKMAVSARSDVSWKIFPYGKFSAIFFQKNFRFLKSSLNISFFLTRVDMSHAHDTA